MTRFVVSLHPSPRKKMAAMSKRMRKAVAKLRTSEGVCKRVVIVGLRREMYSTCSTCTRTPTPISTHPHINLGKIFIVMLG